MLFLVLVALLNTAWAQQLCCPTGECWNTNAPYDHLPLPTGCVTALGVTFQLFTRNNANSPQTFDRNTVPSQFSGSRQTTFLIHGWQNDKDTPWLANVKNALLNRADYNVVVVGWGTGAGDLTYFPSASNTRVVGNEAAAVAGNLVSRGGSAWSRTWCMGHSLGAHTCGQMGTRAAGTMGRCTGMDPAGPAFKNEDNSISIQVGINTGSGAFVDIIHTDSALDGPVRYGTHSRLGHVDFYPNAGGNQPGCSDLKQPALIPGEAPPAPKGDLGCSHGRAVDYMLASISNDCFTAVSSCSSISNIPGSCSSCGSSCPKMGWSCPSSARGVYYLTTTAAAPHCP